MTLSDAKRAHLLTVLVAAALALPAEAQIYKYQDERGKWHFTDRPPAEVKKKAELVGQGGRRAPGPVGEDLGERMMKHFSPKTPAETATLAVVTVKTPLGNGSGFFVSSDGYLLTNRHVVRPETTGQWRKASGELEEVRGQFEAAESVLQERAKVLKQMRKARKELSEAIKRETSSGRRARLQEEHDRLDHAYKVRNKQYQAWKKDGDKKRRAFERLRSDFSARGAATTLSTNFKVILKDKTELRARLVGLSDKSDLALLKVDGYVTPMLEMVSTSEVSQGMSVFAVGSPLGLADAMTKGVVTRVRRDHIMTDAKILPGNSGGPLITEEGKVIGINTLKLARSADAEGFGLAIPVRVASQQFPQMHQR